MSTNAPLRFLRYAYYFLGTAAILLTAAILASNYAFTIFRVDGHSMEPTLHDSQLLPVCMLCLDFNDPLPGQIVIVRYDGADSVDFVKRVMGVPGQTVPYQGQDYTLLPGQYFVVGDNRDHSTDSRAYGPVRRDQILGLVLGSHGSGPGPLEQE